MSHLSAPSLEPLESRTLLAALDGGSESPDAYQGMSWGEVAATGAGMLVYGGVAFIAAEGGECTLTKTSVVITSIGLLMGYHVGSGIAHDWLGLGVVEV